MLRAYATQDAELNTKAEDTRVEDEKTADGGVAETAAETTEAKSVQKSKPSKKTAKSVWFYTCEGERLGPVSFEELRAMAAVSSLDPRLDMVWRQTMDAWQPAGQVDGLFERQTVPVATQAKPAPSAKPIRPPQQSARAWIAMNAFWPGAHRRSLLLIALVFPFVWQYALAAGSPFLVKQFGQILMGKILPLAALLPLVLLLHFGLKRLVNLGMNRLWCLAVFAPVLNLWLGYRCFVCPAGYAYHKKLDGPGIALAILYGLAVLTLAAFVASLCGVIDSPALLEKLRVLIRTASTQS